MGAKVCVQVARKARLLEIDLCHRKHPAYLRRYSIKTAGRVWYHGNVMVRLLALATTTCSIPHKSLTEFGLPHLLASLCQADRMTSDNMSARLYLLVTQQKGSDRADTTLQKPRVSFVT
jgi:hypothetical protein